MSSTDRSHLGREFFVNALLPERERLLASGAIGLDRAADVAATTYFTVRAKTCPSLADFEARPGGNPASFAAALGSYWKEIGRRDLAALSGRFERLASSIPRTVEQKEDLAPFIYVMF